MHALDLHRKVGKNKLNIIIILPLLSGDTTDHAFHLLVFPDMTAFL